MYNPETLAPFLDYWVTSKAKMGLSVREQELVILRMAVLYRSEYVWKHHVKVGREFGVNDTELDAIRRGSYATFSAPRERAFLTLTDTFMKDRCLPPESWSQARNVLGSRDFVDLISLVSQYVLFALTNVCMQVRVEPGVADLTFTVDCARGQTISKALEQGDSRKPMAQIVRGTCNENVTIIRDDVTLQGQAGAGATVSAANAAGNTITVRATRTVISGLTIQGGANGIFVLAASDFTLSDSVVKNAAQSGIYVVSTHAKILRNTIQNSGGHGISLWAADGRVENNQILSNAAAGVHLERNSTVGASGNTITGNGSNGIELRWKGSL